LAWCREYFSRFVVPGNPLSSSELIWFSPGTRCVGESGGEFVADVAADESDVPVPGKDPAVTWRLANGYGWVGMDMVGGTDKFFVWREVAAR
jgi:hypothetical protein